MPNAAKIYIYGITVAGGLVLGCSLPFWSSAHPLGYGIFVALAVLASLLKLRLPGVPGTYSLNFLFVLIGVAHLSLAETLVAGAAAAVAQSYLNAKQRPTVLQVLFNTANLCLSIGLCFFAAHGPLSASLDANRPAGLALVACLYFVTNTMIVSGVLSLLQGKPLAEVCREWYAWSFPYYLVGAVLVGLFSTLDKAPEPEAWLLLLPPLYLVHFFYGLSHGALGGSLGAGKDVASRDSGRDLPFAARLYIETVIVVAVALILISVLRADFHDFPRFAGYFVVALAAFAFKIRLPHMTGTLSFGFVVVLAAIAELSFGEALIIGAAGGAVQSLWRAKVQPRPIQVGFSMGATVLSAALAYFVCRTVLPSATGNSLLSTLVTAAVVFYAANTLLVAVVLCLAEQQPVRRMWQHCCFWSFPYYLLGAACAGLMVVTSVSSGWGPSLLVLPVMALVFISYRLHLGRAAEA